MRRDVVQQPGLGIAHVGAHGIVGLAVRLDDCSQEHRVALELGPQQAELVARPAFVCRPDGIGHAQPVDQPGCPAHHRPRLFRRRHRPLLIALAHVMRHQDKRARDLGQFGQHAHAIGGGLRIGINVGMNEAGKRIDHDQLQVFDSARLLFEILIKRCGFQTIPPVDNQRRHATGIRHWYDVQPVAGRFAAHLPRVHARDASVYLVLVVLCRQNDDMTVRGDSATERKWRPHVYPAVCRRHRRHLQRQVEYQHALARATGSGEHACGAQRHDLVDEP